MGSGPPLETPATSTSSEARYERFTVTYPSGTVFDSVWCEGGGTLRQVQVEHPLAVVEPDESSRVHVEAGP